MPSSSFRIRPAGPDDAAALHALHVTTLRETYGPLAGEEFLGRLLSERSRRGMRREEAEHLASPEARVLLVHPAADPHGEPVGFAVALDGPQGWERHYTDRPLRMRALVNLYVRTAWHGTGLGAALLDAVLDPGPAYLWIVEGNPRAERFYAKHGFRPVEEPIPGKGQWAGPGIFRMLRDR